MSETTIEKKSFLGLVSMPERERGGLYKRDTDFTERKEKRATRKMNCQAGESKRPTGSQRRKEGTSCIQDLGEVSLTGKNWDPSVNLGGGTDLDE